MVHQNRAKCQKREVDYLEMNIGRSRPQPKGKSRTKKLDIVEALREPSETQLAAYRIQEDHHNNLPGEVIGIAIKTEIKSEIKIEMEKVNMRNKYKGSIMPMNPNYIHPDGTPCKHARRESSKLPDLPQVDDTPYDSLNSGLHVETPDNANAITFISMPTSSVMPNTGPSPTQSSEKDSVNRLPVETSRPNNKSPIMTTNTEINSETNEGNGLHVETNMNIHTETTEQNNRLPAEMSETNIANTLSSCMCNDGMLRPK